MNVVHQKLYKLTNAKDKHKTLHFRKEVFLWQGICKHNVDMMILLYRKKWFFLKVLKVLFLLIFMCYLLRLHNIKIFQTK